jgi:hypothetical protein
VLPPASPSDAHATSAPHRVGCTEPRLFTPSLRELTPDTTLGFDVIDFAENDLRIQLHPYQKWLYIHALELLPSGDFRFRTILILIARQNGKTTWWKILVLYAMYVLGFKLTLSTAQDLDTAEETWQSVVDWVMETDDEDEFTHPELGSAVDKVVQVNGKKSLNLKTGERYKAKAASRRAGRGLSGDLIGMDELREHQSWDSWSAITHTTMARARALIVCLSNAGDVSSVVLRFLRKVAHLALGDPDGVNAQDDPAALLDDTVEAPDEADDSLAIFEWSAPPGCSIRDWDGIAQANPSLNHPNGISERAIRAAWKEPEWVYRTEVLCQWSDGTLEGPFPTGSWDAGRWSPQFDGDEPPPVVGKVAACVDVSADHTRAHIAFTGRTDSGRLRTVVVASRAGTDWVTPWLRERRDRILGWTAQGRGAPVSNLLEDWQAEPDMPPFTPWQATDLSDGTAQFYNLVRENGVEHLPQPVLDVAAGVAATKPAGDGVWLWDRKKSPADIAPLVAATGATWLFLRPVEKPFVSVYESRGLVVL